MEHFTDTPVVFGHKDNHPDMDKGLRPIGSNRYFVDSHAKANEDNRVPSLLFRFGSGFYQEVKKNYFS